MDANLILATTENDTQHLNQGKIPFVWPSLSKWISRSNNQSTTLNFQEESLKEERRLG